MMMDKKSTDNIGVNTVIGLEILPKFKSSPKCPVLKCASCQLACAMKQNPDVINLDGIPVKEPLISWDKYKCGNVWEDKFVVKILVV